MQSKRYLVPSLFLSVAMLAPIGAFAMPMPQDEKREEAHERKVYDATHKQYRTWDAKEDDAYRRWTTERHVKYVDYAKLDKKRQEEYWKWRHDHEDHP